MASRPPQHTKRTKTFTGCWTCRERKVKCDEASPHCRQCRRKGLTCQGYNTRLQWLPPVLSCAVDSSGVSLEPVEQIGTSALRRTLPTEPRRRVLLPYQLDDILKSIDALDPEQLPGSDTIFKVNNFSVLRCAVAQQPPDIVTRPSELEKEIVSAPLGSDAIDFHSFEDASAFTQGHSELPSPDADDVQIFEAGDQEPGDPDEPEHIVFTTHSALSQADSEHHELHSIDRSNTMSQSCDWLHSYGTLANDLSSYSTTGLDQFLMRHYMERVCHIFCVLDTPKSPWKTIHLPRALQAMGELSIIGKTSRVRNALLHALLAISAWYLSNDHRRHDANDEADRWATLASKYGFDAISLLKQAVNADLYHVHRPKYKEFLATMLSMVTVNVMSGDTTTCGVHLNGAHQLLIHMRDEKKKASEKTRTLHRIYCYLRIIWESTQVFEDDISGSFVRSIASESVFQLLEQRLPSNSVCAPGNEMLRRPSTMSSYECIYGIPQSLLAILEATINLIDRVNRAKKASEWPDDLDAVCDELEQKILDWSIPETSEPDSPASEGANARIVHHQTMSFHSALVIFFSQNVRSLNHRYLKQYVETVLHSIEAIEQIKTETNMLAAPLFWPAFIAATTAFTSEHQARFRNWYDGANSYGIAAVRTGIRVILEVWSAGPPKVSERMCPWRHIVCRNKENLMLS